MRSGDKLLTFLELTQFLHEWEGRGEGVLVREKKWPGIVAHNYNINTEEAEAGDRFGGPAWAT